ncbi:origin of replication complex subunit 3 isoform X2 [Silene latifolia]|uniref:origin of replication complex subunit 3 isoform X2 n=1 Tax=Silene latifolia TaxID=37657 RepID=UPI003D784D16
MAISDGDSPSTSSPPVENADNNPQPFFVLHKGSSRPKTRRKIDLSHKQSPSSVPQDLEGEDDLDIDEDDGLGHLRIEAFHSVWSNIETMIKGLLREINVTIFNEVNAWAHESFKAVRLHGDLGFAEATRPYPVVTDAKSKQIYTGLVYTKNIEFVDDQLTFEELGNHLKSCGCHVANMSSPDFSAKNGIGGCLTRLLRHFLMTTLDGADMSTLASWYSGQREYKPLVIIIEDTERCCGAILSDFILLLSEWVVKVPVILVMGIATTLDSLRNLLCSNALLQLCTSKFLLGSPSERMNAIVEAVLLRPSSWFRVGYKVAHFLRDYFLKHDGTLTSFVRALKIACMQHFSTESLSFLMKHLAAEGDLKLWLEDSALMKDVVLNYASQLTSCRRVGGVTTEKLVDALSELNSLHKRWATVIMCLYDAGRSVNIQLLDLYCESLDPDPHSSSTFHDGRTYSPCLGYSLRRGSIFQAVQKVRDLPPTALCELVRSWETRTNDVCEICKKVKELQYMMKSLGNKSSGCDLTDISSRNSLRRHSSGKNPGVLNAKAVALIEWMVRDHMNPIEGLPFHEILCFKGVGKLQIALLGDPRKKIQADLLEFHKYMHCSCCCNRGNRLLPSLHDTTILYTLAQEHGDIINVHDWYQSFKAIMVNPSVKASSKSKRPSTPKKRKDANHPQSDSESVIQARFCKAVSELQITGLLRMPSKRRPDYVQRVAFGL